MTVYGFHHVQIACPSGSEATLRQFYGSVIGLPEITKPAPLAARGGVWFSAGAQELHCGVQANFVPATKAHPCFAVEDVDAIATAVAESGAQVRWDDNIAGVRRFHTDDPVGNRIEFQQVEQTNFDTAS